MVWPATWPVGRISRVMVVDLNVHQGNRTASLLADDPRVFCLSAHCASNFPLRKHQGDLDLPEPDGLEDRPYPAAIGDVLADLLDHWHSELVFYSAGVAPHGHDRVGRLVLSREGLFHRDRLVVNAFLRRRIAVATVIGGG